MAPKYSQNVLVKIGACKAQAEGGEPEREFPNVKTVARIFGATSREKSMARTQIVLYMLDRLSSKIHGVAALHSEIV